MVYEDIYDAKMAVEHLSGFNVANRYLIVLYYNPSRQTKKVRQLAALQPVRLGDCSGASPPLHADCCRQLLVTVARLQRHALQFVINGTQLRGVSGLPSWECKSETSTLQAQDSQGLSAMARGSGMMGHAG